MEIKCWTKFQLVTDTIYGCMTPLTASGGRGGEWYEVLSNNIKLKV